MKIITTETSDYGFTAREKDVMYLLVKGLKNDDIANVLHISISTVKANLTNIFDKLGVGNRTQAVAKIFEEKLIPHQG